jgi:hypothetical protein
MISQLLSLTPGSLAVGFLLSALLIQLVVRLRYEFKVRRAGGVHAPQLAKNPLTALSWLWTIGWAQAQNRLFELFNQIMDNYTSIESPNAAEINVTGGQRYIFTREPEHIKTILTGKFADYGKGDEFHRVWVSVTVVYLTVKSSSL